MKKIVEKQGLGALEESILSILEYKKIKLIKKQELIKLIKEHTKTKDIEDLITRLRKKKYLLPVLKGIYAVVPLSSIDKVALVSEIEIVDYLLEQEYYIGLYNAFNRQGFTEQIPNMFFVYNTKYSGDKKILQFRIRFFKIKKEKLFGRTNDKYPYSDKERTIIDVLDNPIYISPLSEIMDRIKEAKYDENKLIDYSIKYNSVKVIKLVGILTNNSKLLKKLQEKKALSYYTTLKNTGTKLLDKKWKIRLT
jgi:predicted transcriptional regulator of viral defense system